MTYSASPGYGNQIFAQQAVDPAELSQVARDDDETAASRVAGDQYVVAADGLASPLQVGANIRRVVSGIGVERQHVQPSCEPRDLSPIVFRLGGFRRAMQQLRQHDGRDAQLVGLVVESFTQ